MHLVMPELDESLCIGCGACENVCPVEPTAIRIRGLQVQQKIMRMS
jgi:ferredoxin